MRIDSPVQRIGRAAVCIARGVLMATTVAMTVTPLVVIPSVVHAADDDTVARAREMLRRAQQALQQVQSDNQQLMEQNNALQRQLQQQRQTASKQLEASRSGSRSAQQVLQSQLQATQTADADLHRRLDDAAARLVDADNRQRQTAAQLAQRESELASARQSLVLSRTADMSCEDKNLKLYGYAEEVLQLYHKKGVWAALAQKEPVLGLKEVGVQNVVQEYQAKFDSRKVKP